MGAMIYNSVPIWFIAILVGALLFAITEAAWWIERRRKGTSHDTPYDIALNPAFTMVALLLGFVFSMALQRYDARVAAVLHEANAIRCTAIFCDVLEPPQSVALREKLKAYAEARVAFAAADADPAGRLASAARSFELQHEMVALAMAASRQNPGSGNIPLLLTALNDMITASAEEASALSEFIPPAVILMLVLTAIIASSMMGVRLAAKNQRSVLAAIMLAGMLALILGTVIDLDQPQRGFIRVSLEPLRAVQRGL